MQGHHEYQPELFSAVDVELLIPKGHLLRRIDRVLDLSFLPELTSSLYAKANGRPSIDPEVFVRMILLQAIYNIDSDRQLCEEVGFNLAYRWFSRLSLRDPVPDHSSITRIRDRFGETTYRKIFTAVVCQCAEAGLVKGERVMADGSMIAANASLYAMVERAEKIEETPSGSLGVQQEPSKDGLSIKDLRKNSIVGKKITNQTHFCKTDPDATLAGKSGEYKALRHKTHDIIDAGSRVILDCHVTTGTVSEHKVFPDRLMVVQNEFNLSVGEVIADRGYGAGDVLEFLEERGIGSNIPLWSTRVGAAFEKEEGFIYDRKQNAMTCPKGITMKRTKMDQDSNLFVLSKVVCEKCPPYQTCVTEVERRNGRGKRVRIHRRQHLFQAVLAKETKPEFVTKLRERMWKMEGIFAEAKSHHGMRRARYRGRTKVQMQVYVVATVQNLKRLAASIFDDLCSVLRILIFGAQTPKKILKVRFS